jgi:hypothetical protein
MPTDLYLFGYSSGGLSCWYTRNLVCRMDAFSKFVDAIPPRLLSKGRQGMIIFNRTPNFLGAELVSFQRGNELPLKEIQAIYDDVRLKLPKSAFVITLEDSKQGDRPISLIKDELGPATINWAVKHYLAVKIKQPDAEPMSLDEPFSQLRLDAKGDDDLNAKMQLCSLESAKRCQHCGLLSFSSLRCNGCKKVYYCSKEHQRLDWPKHRSQCRAR